MRKDENATVAGSTALLIAVGAVLGVAIASVPGFLAGGFIGFLLGRDMELRRRLERVEMGTQPPSRPQAATVAGAVASQPDPAIAPAPDVTATPSSETGRRDGVHTDDPAMRSVDPLTWLTNAVKTWVLTGNAPVKVGVLVSLIGLGFLIREANERGLIELTIEMRLIAVTMFGLVLLAVGWHLRSQRPVYGLSLQGGGVAVLYLTSYAAFAVYDVLPAPLALLAVVTITVGAGVLAVAQDSRSLAVLGIIGGFLAPVLAYSQPGDHVVIFSFYAILNAAIVGVAWFKIWPELNLIGLGSTFGITAFWLLDRHTQDDWVSTQPFIALFVTMYMAIPVLFATRKAPDLKDVWTAPLVFGTPFMGLGLQQLVVGHTEYGMATSALVLALVHGVSAMVTRRLGRECLDLAEAYTGLGVTFSAIAVPFALDAHFTATVWALQGVLLLWIGIRRSQMLAAVVGTLLQALAGVSFGTYLSESLPYPSSTLPIANEYFLGAAVLAGAGLTSGWLLHRGRDRLAFDVAASWIALAWGIGWWLAGGLTEIGYQLSTEQLPTSLVFVVFSLGATAWPARRSRWPHLDFSGLLILPTLVVGLYIALVHQAHPLDLYGWAAWPVSIAAYYAFLRLREGAFPRLQTVLHTGGYWVLAVIIGVEVSWQTDQVLTGAWPLVVAPTAVLVLVGATLSGRRRLAWPLGAHWRSYVTTGTGPVLAVLAVLMLAAIVLSEGNFSPLPYLPLLNPLEILAALVVMIALMWRRQALAEGGHPFRGFVEAPWALPLAAIGTVLVTMTVARTVHHWLDVPFDGESMFDSAKLQASLSVVWALIALAGMVAGVSSARRAVWVAGASFMAVVVLKLFLIDLSSQGTLSRVVSFMGVGVLLLIVGYFAPVPPPAPTEVVE